MPMMKAYIIVVEPRHFRQKRIASATIISLGTPRSAPMRGELRSGIHAKPVILAFLPPSCRATVAVEA